MQSTKKLMYQTNSQYLFSSHTASWGKNVVQGPHSGNSFIPAGAIAAALTIGWSACGLPK